MRIMNIVNTMRVIGFVAAALAPGIVIPLAIRGMLSLAVKLDLRKPQTPDEIIIYNRAEERMKNELESRLNSYLTQQGYNLSDEEYDYVYKAVFHQAYEEEKANFYLERT